MEGQVKSKEWDWRKRKPNNVLKVKATLERNFFKWWLIFLRPFVSLTPKEIDIVAAFLEHRLELLDRYSDPEVVDTLLMDSKIKTQVIKECNITLQHFYVVMSALRKKKVLSDKGINPRLIPNIRKDENGVFQLLILFEEKVRQKDGLQ